MAGGIVGRPGETKSKRVLRANAGGVVEFFLEIREHAGLVHGQSAGIARQTERAIQLIVRQTGDVVEIQRVPGVARASHIGMRPICCRLQIKVRIAMR